MQAQAAGGAAQALGLLALAIFQIPPEPIGLQLGLTGRRRTGPGTLQPLHALLNQHLGHVADRARLGVSQIGQTLAEVFRQNHLDAGRLGPAAGGGLARGH